MLNMGTNEFLDQTETALQHSKAHSGYQKRKGTGKGNEEVQMNRHTRLCKIIKESPL